MPPQGDERDARVGATVVARFINSILDQLKA